MEQVIEINSARNIAEVINYVKFLDGYPESKKIIFNFYDQKDYEFNLKAITKLLDCIDFNKKKHPEFDLEITFSNKTGFFLDKKQKAELIKIDKFLAGREVSFKLGEYKETNKYSLKEHMIASDIVEEFATSINDLKLPNQNGIVEKLSPFEKFIFIYEFVSRFIYNMGDDIKHERTSNWVPVLLGDKIICGGYGSLLTALTARTFCDEPSVKVLPSIMDVFNNELKVVDAHVGVLVRIKDDKYNIDGIFHADPCWDSAKQKQSTSRARYCLLTADQIAQDKANLMFSFSNPLNIYLLSENKRYRDLVAKLVDKYINYNEDQAQNVLSKNYYSDSCFKRMQTNLNAIKKILESSHSDQEIFENLQKFLNEDYFCELQEVVEEKKINENPLKGLKRKAYDDLIKERNACQSLIEKPIYDVLIVPDDESSIKKNPHIENTLNLIERCGLKALDDEKTCDEFLKAIKANQTNYSLFHYSSSKSLHEFLKSYADKNYYIPRQNKIISNANAMICHTQEESILKNPHQYLKKCFDIAPISATAFKSAFYKLAQFYDFNEKDTKQFIDYKMKDVLSRDFEH